MRGDTSACTGQEFTIYYKDPTSGSKLLIALLTKDKNPKDLKEKNDFVHKYDNSKNRLVNIF